MISYLILQDEKNTIEEVVIVVKERETTKVERDIEKTKDFQVSFKSGPVKRKQKKVSQVYIKKQCSII
jgi:hypothetical protein